MNPILPLQYFIPDSEPHVWQDGRLYIYGSSDKKENKENNTYCSNEYHVFSSDNLIDWTDHGISFQSKDANGQIADVPWSTDVLFAPDCMYKDGKYYLYFCQAGGAEGVAVSDKPYGPFKEATIIEGAHKDAIDPAIFIDDDGQAYYYWGQFHCRGAKLKSDMKTLEKDSIQTDLINEAEHGFHEGSSMRKRNGLYYLIYADISRGKASCLSYATSTSPLGPFTKGGVIIDNDGCDKETWNNHGSIAVFNGQWYVVYHRAVFGSRFVRRACMEKIEFDKNGAIKEVEMTTQGTEGPIDATQTLEAYRACLMTGELTTKQYEENNQLTEVLVPLADGDCAAYKYIDFKEGMTSLVLTVRGNVGAKGEVIITLDREKETVIGSQLFTINEGEKNTQKVIIDIARTKGVHALWLTFNGQGYEVINFKFQQA